MGNATPDFDWYSLLKAELESAAFISWKSAYKGQGEAQAWTNLLSNVPVTLDMLIGWGNFVHFIHQAQIGIQAYCQLGLQSSYSMHPAGPFTLILASY